MRIGLKLAGLGALAFGAAFLPAVSAQAASHGGFARHTTDHWAQHAPTAGRERARPIGLYAPYRVPEARRAHAAFHYHYAAIGAGLAGVHSRYAHRRVRSWNSQPAYAPDYGYAHDYGYAQETTTYVAPQPVVRSYMQPTTVYQPVTRTYTVPVQAYRTVAQTRYVPVTTYRAVTTEVQVPVTTYQSVQRTEWAPVSAYQKVTTTTGCGCAD